MKKGNWLAVVALLAVTLTGAQIASADDAATVIGSTFLGEEVFFRTNFTNFELAWTYTPGAVGDTFAAAAAPTPIPWAIGWDLGAAGFGDEKFAIITGMGGVPSVVTHGGVVLDDITGADAAAFASFIGAGVGSSNVTVFGVGQISQVGGVTSAIEKSIATVPNPVADITNQMTFVLRGLPITAIVGSPLLGTVSTLFGPGGELAFYEDSDLDFDPRDPLAGPGIPLTTAEFVQATGEYHAGAANDEDEKAANDPGDPQQSTFLTFAYAPTPGDSLSLTEQWDFGAFADTAYKAVIGGVSYYVQGSSQFVNLGRPFLITGGLGSGLFGSGVRFDVSGQVLFGFNPATNAAFANPDDPSTFTFVSGAGIGANPQLKGGPVIPEPTTGLLLGLGMLGAAAARRRRLA